MTVNKSISCFSNLFHTFNIINAFVFILCKIFLTQAHSSTQSINDLYSAFDLLPIRLWNGWPLKSKVESFNKKSKLVKTFEVTRHWKTSCSYLGTSMCNASVGHTGSDTPASRCLLPEWRDKQNGRKWKGYRTEYILLEELFHERFIITYAIPFRSNELCNSIAILFKPYICVNVNGLLIGHSFTI